MRALHPLFLDHAWVAGIGPIDEFNTAVTNALRLGLPSLVVEGESGVGKTTAAGDLYSALAADNKIVPWRASAVGIKTRADVPRFFRTFQREAPFGLQAPVRLPVLSDQEKVINNILLSCDEAETQRVMLLIDEAQELEYPVLVSLKDGMEQLLSKAVHLFVLLFAEPDIKAKPAQLMARPGGNSLAHRFFATVHHYRGMSARDFAILMEHCDLASWPANGGPKYTEHFVPQLYREGWRLGKQAPYLWNEFCQQAEQMRLDVSALEVLPRFVVRALRYILTELQRNLHQSEDIPSLMAVAVQKSGFAEAWQLQQAAEERRGKGAGQPPKRRR